MRVVLIGFGNLGRGLSRVLIQKASFLRKSHGLIPRVVAIVDEFGAAVDEKGLNLTRLLKVAGKAGTVAAYKGGKRGKLAHRVIEGVEADVVYELTPTNIKTGEPGLTHIKRAMRAGKHVITSNKGPLVVAFRELDSLARRCGVDAFDVERRVLQTMRRGVQVFCFSGWSRAGGGAREGVVSRERDP